LEPADPDVGWKAAKLPMRNTLVEATGRLLEPKADHAATDTGFCVTSQLEDLADYLADSA
jgi:hypothetical protein